MSEETPIPMHDGWDAWYKRQPVNRIGQDVFINFRGEFLSAESVVDRLPSQGTPNHQPLPRIGIELPRIEREETEVLLQNILRLQIARYSSYEIALLHRRLFRQATIVVGRATETEADIPMVTPEDSRLIGHTHPSYLGGLGEVTGVEAARRFVADEQNMFGSRVWGILESQGQNGGLCLSPSLPDMLGFANRLRSSGQHHSEVIVSPFGISRFSLRAEDKERVSSRQDLDRVVKDRYEKVKAVIELPSDDRLPVIMKEFDWKIQIFDDELRGLVAKALPALQENLVVEK